MVGLSVCVANAALAASPGTFITEWTDGQKLCEAFLAGGEEAYHAVSEQLARIAQHYRFDGWLVNMENTLSVSCSHTLPASLPPPLPSCCSRMGPLAHPVPTCPCSLLPGGGGGEPAPLLAALDSTGAQHRAGGTGDLVRQCPAERHTKMAERAE